MSLQNVDEVAERRLIVGLGNPGAKYDKTRHNAGFAVVQSLAEKLGWTWQKTLKRDALVAKGTIGDLSLTLLMPQLYINRSGPVVKRFEKKLSVALSDLLVVVDDAELPLGKIRLRRKGSSGGHNGLKSIEEMLGSQEYPRLKLGIGRGEDLEKYVLERFHPDEVSLFTEEVAQAVHTIEVWLERGIEEAMQIAGDLKKTEN